MDQTVSRQINLSEFWKAYASVLISFITSRLLIQTDMVMVAPLGSAATAAFAVPGKLMVIDAIFAFALGPVISVAVSREKEEAKKNKSIVSALGFTLALSTLLTVLGLLCYPTMIDYLIGDKEVGRLAHANVFWMTLSIPVRLLTFISTMCLFASGRGRQVSYVYAITLTANAVLDWFLIYKLNYGFAGAYISTFLVSSIELVWLIYITYSLVKQFPFGQFDFGWVKSIGGKISAEWLRLMSWQAEGLVVLALLASRSDWSQPFSAFGVTSEFTTLLLMPLLALMRTSAMQLAAANPDNHLGVARQLIRPVRNVAFISTVLVGLTIAVMSTAIGKYIYHLDGLRLEWWRAFSVTYGICFPVYAYSYVQRSCYQACNMFSEVTRIEMLVTWLLFIPTLYFSLVRSAPALFFFGYIGKEMLIAMWLRFRSLNSYNTVPA